MVNTTQPNSARMKMATICLRLSPPSGSTKSTVGEYIMAEYAVISKRETKLQKR